jgi:hypothetical protein
VYFLIVEGVSRSFLLPVTVLPEELLGDKSFLRHLLLRPMLVPVVEELMQQHLKLTGGGETWVNLNLPRSEPSTVSPVLAELSTFDLGQAWHVQ